MVRDMGAWDDQRGQSEVVGAILVFAILVLLIGIWQATVIPQETEEIEFKHNQDVRDQMRDVQVGIDSAGSTDTSQSATVTLGVDYPTRAIFINPGPVAGTIRTVEDTTSTVSIANARALSLETEDYWGGGQKTFDTKSLEYRINYNRFQNPATVRYENSVLYNSFDNGITVQSRGGLIDGRRISLTVLDGDLSTSRVGSATVNVKPLSAPRTTVPVQETKAGLPITLTLTTSLSEEKWRGDILADEYDGPDDDIDDAYISRIECIEHDDRSEPCDGELKIELEDDATYKLQMAKVGVGSGYDMPTRAYMTDLQGHQASLPELGRQQLVVQVRDEFNNPVTGEEVEFWIEDGDGEFVGDDDTPTRVTDENGRATVTYQAPGSLDTSPLEVAVGATYGDRDDFNPRHTEDVQFDLRVINGSQVDQSEPLFNPAEGLTLQSAEIDESDACSGNDDPCAVNITFGWTGGDDSVTIDAVRYTFYSPDSQGASPTANHRTMWIEEPTTSGPYELGGTFDDSVSIEVPNGLEDAEDEGRVRVRFEGDGPSRIEEGDFFVLEFIVDGVRQTYFIVPEDSD